MGKGFLRGAAAVFAGFMMFTPGAFDDDMNAAAADSELTKAATHALNASVGILRLTEVSPHDTVEGALAVRGSGTHLGDGYILTAGHVVEQQKGSKTAFPPTIRILTKDMIELPATFEGANEFLDIVLYRVDPEKAEKYLAAITFSNEEPKPGEKVFTVGYPLGRGPALHYGHGGNPETFLSTAQSRLIQVSIYSCGGGSGSALLNSAGKIAGMLQAITGPGASQGDDSRCSNASYVIPGPQIARAVAQIKEGKHLSFPGLGIKLGFEKLGDAWRAVVETASKEARHAGFRKGDAFLSIDGKPVTTGAHLKSRLTEDHQPGDVIDIGVMRNGKEIHLSFTLGGS